MAATVASPAPHGSLGGGQSMIMCGPPSVVRELYDQIFLRAWKEWGLGMSKEEFARSGEAKPLYAGKVLADFWVYVRWNRRNLAVKVDPADPQWHMRMRKAFAAIISRSTNVSGPLDPRRIRLEDARRPPMTTRIDETGKGLTLLSRLAQFELRLVVLEPPGEGRLEPIAEPPSYKFKEPAPPALGCAAPKAAPDPDDQASCCEANARQLHCAILASMNPIAARLVRMGDAAPKGLRAMHEHVLKEMYTAPAGSNVARMDVTGTLHPALVECACPDVAAASNELSLAYARKICKILTFAHDSTDTQIDTYVKNACSSIADKFQTRAVAWGMRGAPHLECPDPTTPAATTTTTTTTTTNNLGTALPSKLHTVCNPIGERVVTHIEQHLIASSYTDPYRQTIATVSPSTDAITATTHSGSIFEDRDRLAAFAIENGKRRAAYIAGAKDAIESDAPAPAEAAQTTELIVPSRQQQQQHAEEALQSPETAGMAVRSAILGGRPMLRVDPIGTRLLSGDKVPAPLAAEAANPPYALRVFECAHCAGGVGYADELPAHVAAAGNSVDTLREIECPHCAKPAADASHAQQSLREIECPHCAKPATDASHAHKELPGQPLAIGDSLDSLRVFECAHCAVQPTARGGLDVAMPAGVPRDLPLVELEDCIRCASPERAAPTPKFVGNDIVKPGAPVDAQRAGSTSYDGDLEIFRCKECYPDTALLPHSTKSVSCDASARAAERVESLLCCRACCADTQILAVADEAFLAERSVVDKVPFGLPVAECIHCAHPDVPHAKCSGNDPVSVLVEESLLEAPTEGPERSSAVKNDVRQPQARGDLDAPSNNSEEVDEQEDTYESSEQESVEPQPKQQQQQQQQQQTKQQQRPQSDHVSVPGVNVRLPPPTRFTPVYAAAVASPLPAYPARHTSLLRVVNSSDRDVTVTISGQDRSGASTVTRVTALANCYVDAAAFPSGVHSVQVTDPNTGENLATVRKYRFTQRNLHALDYEGDRKVTMRMVHDYVPQKLGHAYGLFERLFGKPGGRVSADTGIYVLPSANHIGDPLTAKHIFVRASVDEARNLMERSVVDDGVFSGGEQVTYRSFEVPAHQTNVGTALRLVRDELNGRIAVKHPDGTVDWAHVENVFSVKDGIAAGGHGSIVMVVDAPIEHVRAAAEI